MSKRWAATNVLKYMGKYMGNLWIYPLYLYHLIVIWFPSAIVSKKKKKEISKCIKKNQNKLYSWKNYGRYFVVFEKNQ